MPAPPNYRRKAKVVRERDIEKAANRYAKARGWFIRKLQWVSVRGAPDRLYARRGQIFFVEWKAKGEKPTDLQRAQHYEMEQAGLNVVVLDNSDPDNLSLLFD